MGDILPVALAFAMLYLFSLGGVSYALSKPKKVRNTLIIAITIAISLFVGWTVKINEDKIPVEQVNKAWKQYTVYCKENHTSWSDLTFPEWLEGEASSLDYMDGETTYYEH